MRQTWRKQPLGLSPAKRSNRATGGGLRFLPAYSFFSTTKLLLRERGEAGLIWSMSGKRSRVYVVVGPRHKRGAADVLRALLPWLRQRARVVRVDDGEKNSLREADADLAVVFGGDGTMLSVARRLRGNPLPVLGVNLGRLGFLTEVYPEEFKTVMPRVLRGEYRLSPRMMLSCRVTPAGGKQRRREYVALNDVVIQRRPHGSTLLEVRVAVSGEEIAQHIGDGLIVATATGSTAYNLSAGGPILSERLKAFTVVPICPHTLANRPIVVAGNETIEIAADSRSGEGFAFVVDGRDMCSLPGGSEVVVSRAACKFNLIEPGCRGRYEIIREKLHWAGWVDNNASARRGSAAGRREKRNAPPHNEKSKGRGT